MKRRINSPNQKILESMIRKGYDKLNHKMENPNQVHYVKFKTRLTQQQLNEQKSKIKAISIKHATKRTDLIPSAANVVIVEGGDINQIKQDTNVTLVERAPSITYHDEITDPLYDGDFTRDQRYMNYGYVYNMNHKVAIEEFGFGSHSPLLGMMDGVVLSENLPFTDKPPHPDLEGKVTYYQDTNDITPLAQNNIGHGTAVASLITTNTNNGWGMGGTCPNASIVYFDSLYNGEGLFPMLEGGLELGIRATNISMGGSAMDMGGPGDSFSTIIQDAINDAYNQGLILIVSAGNVGVDLATYGHYTYAGYSNVICVTANRDYNFDSSGEIIDVSTSKGECVASVPNSNVGGTVDGYGNDTEADSDNSWFRSFNGTS